MTKRNVKYFWSEKQVANVVLAARGKSDCPKAKKLVKKLDKKYHLIKERR